MTQKPLEETSLTQQQHSGVDYRRQKTPGPLRAGKRYKSTKSKFVTLATQQDLIRVASYRITHIIGIDEVGSGCWAGPYVAGAAVFPVDFCPKIKDSKAYSTDRARRRALEMFSGRGDVDLFLWNGGIEQLNKKGLAAAQHDSVVSLIEETTALYPNSLVILDGDDRFIPSEYKGFKGVCALPKADVLVPAVAAASIYAKVTRDAYMSQLPYLEYEFHNNKGYGTAVHAKILQEIGICPEHRTFIIPVQEIMRKHAKRRNK